MAVRSIWSIDIDDAGFKKFQQQFDRYRKLLSSSPAEWKKVQDAIGGTRKAFEALVAAETASLARTKLIADAQNEAARRTQTLADRMGRVAESAKSVAGHLLSASRYVLRLAAGTTAVTGLLGAGGLWGLDRLAIAASAGRRSSLGLGLSFGAQQSFGVNYSRLVNPEQFLGGVNAALHDLSQRPALYGAGLTEADIRGKDTGQVAAALIPALKRLADQTPSAQLGQVLQARHLDQFISLQDFERIKALSPGELNDYRKHFMQDTVRFNLTQQQLSAWQKLQVQLTRAGDSIEATFIRGLAPLAPQLAKLSQGFSDIVDALLNSKAVKGWIQDLADGLEWMAKWIGSPKFKQDVEDFATAVGNMAKAIGAGIEWLAARIPGLQNYVTPSGPGVDPKGHRVGPNGGLWQNPDGSIINPESGKPYKEISPGVFQPAAFSVPTGPVSDREREAHDYFRKAGYTEQGTDAILGYIRGESGFNPGAFNPAGGGQGAQGIAQWRGARIDRFRAMFGHDPRNGTFEEQLAFMQWELTHTEGAAGNALSGGGSTGQLAADFLRLYGRPSPDQLAALQQQRAGYAMGYQQRFNAPSRGGVTNVYVHDRTGGSVVVSAAQLAT